MATNTHHEAIERVTETRNDGRRPSRPSRSQLLRREAFVKRW
jgi:hypothetical protein